MIDTAHADAAPGVFLRQVLQRRMQRRWCDEFLLLVVDLHDVAVGIVKAVRAAAAEIAVAPADAEAGLVDCFGAAFERLRARRAPGDTADTVGWRFGKLESRGRVVAVAAHIDRRAAGMHDLHAEQIAEVPEAPVGRGGEELDTAEMRDVVDRFSLRRHARLPLVSRVTIARETGAAL
jgi:hypothetical protein